MGLDLKNILCVTGGGDFMQSLFYSKNENVFSGDLNFDALI